MDPRRADLLIASGLLALAQAETWLGSAAEGRRVPTAIAAVAIAGALAVRRRHPLGTVVVVGVAVTALALGWELPNVAFLLPAGLLAAYTVAAHASQERALAGLALMVFSVPVGAVNTEDATFTDLSAPGIAFAAAWGIGRGVRARRLRAEELERDATRVMAESEERERAAVTAERARIARELHDIVAHHVTSMVIQAESGRSAAHDTRHSEQAFAGIATSGRHALAELRRLLDVLHADDGTAAAVAPQPGIEQLPALAEEARNAGLPVELSIGKDVQALPSSVDLAAYRVAQEALTNALRHARTPTTLRLTREGGELHLEVRNALAVAPADGDGAGRGLAGMRERVRLYDGRLDARAVDGDFVVHAVLPLQAGSA